MDRPTDKISPHVYGIVNRGPLARHHGFNESTNHRIINPGRVLQCPSNRTADVLSHCPCTTSQWGEEPATTVNFHPPRPPPGTGTSSVHACNRATILERMNSVNKYPNSARLFPSPSFRDSFCGSVQVAELPWKPLRRRSILGLRMTLVLRQFSEHEDLLYVSRARSALLCLVADSSPPCVVVRFRLLCALDVHAFLLAEPHAHLRRMHEVAE